MRKEHLKNVKDAKECIGNLGGHDTKITLLNCAHVPSCYQNR